MGTVMAAATLYVFTNHPGELIYKQTLALTILAIIQWLNAWNCRSEKSIFLSKPWRNPWLIVATATVALLQILAVYWLPFQRILKTTPLTAHDWQTVLLFSLTIILADELYKCIHFLFKKRP